MHRVTSRLAATAGTALLAVGLLTGCGAATEPDETATPAPAATSTAAPAATPDPEPSESATPAPAALVIPTCENLVALETAKQALSEAAVAFDDLERPDPAVALPELADLLDAASQEQWCSWGIPQSDGLFWVIVAEVDDATRDDAIAALTADARYTAGELDGAQTFSLVEENELGLLSTMYAAMGTAWVTVWGTLADWGTNAVAGDALATLKAANPELAG